jgi:hypothetical protein
MTSRSLSYLQGGLHRVRTNERRSRRFYKQKALAFTRGLFVSVIVSRRFPFSFPFLADLAVTYSSKP